MNPHRKPTHRTQSRTSYQTGASLRALLRHASPALVALALTTTLGHAADKPRSIPPPQPANTYAAFETHPNERVTIAAEPCTDPKDCSFFRLPYVQHGFIPVRVIVTNDRDTPLALDDVRIQFISANSDKIPAATDEDINRRLFSTRSAQPSRVPIIPIPIHHTPVDKKVIADGNDFGFNSTTVAPHTTIGGYLFYDVRGLDDPPIKGAELYVKMIHTTDQKNSPQELFAFSIPFEKWVASHPQPASH